MPRPPANTSTAAANLKYVEKMNTYLASVSEWDKRKDIFIATEKKDHENVRNFKARTDLERAQLQEQNSQREHREPEYTHERDLLECKNDGTILFVDPRSQIALFLKALDQKLGLLLINRVDEHLQNEASIRQMCLLGNRAELSGRELWTQVAHIHCMSLTVLLQSLI